VVVGPASGDPAEVAVPAVAGWDELALAYVLGVEMDAARRHSAAEAVGATISSVAGSPTSNIEVDSALLERARRVARERGVAVPQLVREALEHEMGPAEGEGHVDEWGDLDKFSARASRGVLRHMTEEEEKAGLSWEEFRPQ
jgi:hypothetical protein